MTDWHALSETLQLQLAQAALREASKNIAACAEALAAEMEFGAVADRGGREALRLFADLVRNVHASEVAVEGHC